MAEMLFCRAVKGEVLNTLWTDYPYIIFTLLIILFYYSEGAVIAYPLLW